MKRSLLSASLVAVFCLILAAPGMLAQHLVYNSACVDTRFGSDANCTANDSSDETFSASINKVEEDCSTGTPGYATIDIDVVLSQQNASTRYDVGVLVNQEGRSAKTDETASCAARHLLEGNPNAFNVDGDACADRQQAGNIVFIMEDVQVKCPDDSSADLVISMCRVWDQNANTVCENAHDLKPGTSAKCSCGDFVLGPVVPPGTLPVELTSFTADIDDSSVILRWATASETENAGFAIEHADEGDFREVDFVPGQGTTQEPANYSYLVSDLAPGRHRFRLKQVDYDGVFEYTSELELAVGLPDRFHLDAAYPNPFRAMTSVSFLLGREQHVKAELLNLLGSSVRTLYDGVAEANTRQTVRIDANGLGSGVYIVRFSGVNFTASQKVVLLK